MTQLTSVPTQSNILLGTEDARALIHAYHAHPHQVLGMHPITLNNKPCLIVRAFLCGTQSCEVVDIESKEDYRFSLKIIHPDGLFEGIIENRTIPFKYRLRAEKTNAEIIQFYDPYAFLPTLSESDVYLFNQGNHHHIYDFLGSHVRTLDGVTGVSFAVWAPSAKRVSVVGDFNHWDGRYHPMRTLGASGIWEIFIPGLEPHMKYKYELIGADGFLRLKTDPYAMYFEAPPYNASIVYDIKDYTWSDHEWMQKRAQTPWREKPISIYEVHLGSWKRVVEDGNRPLTYIEAAQELADYVTRMGYTHVQFMPLAEHPFSGSWGYQVTGFFAPTHRYGTPHDFMKMVDVLHQNNIGVLVDWVPAHFPRDTFALADFDGTHLYEHADPRQGQHQDWGTLIFNYGRHEVRNFLKASALAWFDRFHVDGMRVDAVASMLYLDYSREHGEWIPNEYGGRENIDAIHFLRDTNDRIHEYYPGTLMIAEESTAWGGVSHPTSEGGLGFDFKWNMGWMHDTLEYFKQDPLFRKYHHHKLTFGMLYQYTENFISVFSHDEVVHGKGSMIMKMGSWYMHEKAQTLRALYGFMWGWPGKNTLFMGSDFGQSHEWHYDQSLDWHLLQYQDHSGIQNAVRSLNHFYQQYPTLAQNDYNSLGFQWINTHDENNSTFSFIRTGHKPEDTFLVVGHFTPVERSGYRVGVPHQGFWKECVNTNASEFGGSGLGNLGGLYTDDYPWNARPYSLNIYLPPLTTLIFKYVGESPKDTTTS